MTTALNPMLMRTAESPAGTLFLTGDKYHIYTCSFAEPQCAIACGSTEILEKAVNQLNEYFAGKRREFDIPLEMEGSPFYMHVWMVIRQIDYGQTVTYKEIADLLHIKNGARAVGRALSENPLLIIVPCHRILGENGSLTGYAGGKEKKRFLLRLEQEYVSKEKHNLLF